MKKWASVLIEKDASMVRYVVDAVSEDFNTIAVIMDSFVGQICRNHGMILDKDAFSTVERQNEQMYVYIKREDGYFRVYLHEEKRDIQGFMVEFDSEYPVVSVGMDELQNLLVYYDETTTPYKLNLNHVYSFVSVPLVDTF